MIVVLGASGNTGSAAAKRLLEFGDNIRAVGRDEAKLAGLAQAGAAVAVADLGDTASLAKAFAGADRAYLLVPPRPKEPDLLAASDRFSTSIVEALKDSPVRRVVLLSSVGAQHDQKTGPIVGLHWFESKLKQIPGLNAVFLRPPFFLENFFMLIGLIKSMGFLAGGIKADKLMQMIAARDIGEVAADVLHANQFTGISVRELHGQRDVTHDQAAEAIGTAIGKPKLSYQKFPGFMIEQAMKQMGMPGKTAALMAELSEAANDGLLEPQQPRTADSTTRTSIEEWARDIFLPAYHAKPAS
jgi:uncharacterized protein YbjT (DUF2867 family)